MVDVMEMQTTLRSLKTARLDVLVGCTNHTYVLHLNRLMSEFLYFSI